MVKKDFKKYKLPDSPGVYFFKKGQSALYIGKATSLKDRVASYFIGDLTITRGPRIKTMIEEITNLDWQETDSVLEALLLETALIKKLKPKYNIRQRDDKSHLYVIITKETWPRILIVRGRDLSTQVDLAKIKYSFGPFPDAGELKVALSIIRKIFPFRDQCLPVQFLSLKKVKFVRVDKPCFNRQIGLCPGVCTGEISQRDYIKQVAKIKLLFEGKKDFLIKQLKKEMTIKAKNRQFEAAAGVRNQIFALNHIRDVALINSREPIISSNFRIEAYDIAHFAGREMIGVMTVLLDGEPARSEYRRFKLKGQAAEMVDDTANLKEVISRRLTHADWPKPKLIVVDGGRAQINATKKVLSEKQIKIPVIGVVKDRKHRPKEIIGVDHLKTIKTNEILLANNEAHRFAVNYHRQRLRKKIF